MIIGGVRSNSNPPIGNPNKDVGTRTDYILVFSRHCCKESIITTKEQNNGEFWGVLVVTLTSWIQNSLFFDCVKVSSDGVPFCLLVISITTFGYCSGLVQPSDQIWIETRRIDMQNRPNTNAVSSLVNSFGYI